MTMTISRQELNRLVDGWIAKGQQAVGPVCVKEGMYRFTRLKTASEIKLDGYIRPVNSIKEFVFPKHEPIYKYAVEGTEVALTNTEPSVTPQLIVGARPCDAAALPIMDKVFNWDFSDDFYNLRRNALTVIAIACTQYDYNCFCTSVGLTPDADRGSDVLLLPLDALTFEVKCLTEKGKAVLEGFVTETQTATTYKAPILEKRFDVEKINASLKDGFLRPEWAELGLRCLGCGTCAYSCPTCHCFDIVDEGNARKGARVKNWDSCQFNMFTLHASGHNPRSTQAQRQRQRILHKFSFYREKFGEYLCTGCGNCTRNCPVALGILTAMELLSKEQTEGRS